MQWTISCFLTSSYPHIQKHMRQSCTRIHQIWWSAVWLCGGCRDGGFEAARARVLCVVCIGTMAVREVGWERVVRGDGVREFVTRGRSKRAGHDTIRSTYICRRMTLRLIGRSIAAAAAATAACGWFMFWLRWFNRSIALLCLFFRFLNSFDVVVVGLWNDCSRSSCVKTNNRRHIESENHHSIHAKQARSHINR